MTAPADRPPLPSQVKLRVGILIGGGLLLVLIGLPVEISTLTRPAATVPDRLFIFFVGVGLPLLAFLAAYVLVRRYRDDPDRARRGPNAVASRILVIGNMICTAVAVLLLSAVGPGLTGWLAAVAVALVGSLVVGALARQEDPRIRYFGRMDQAAPTDD